jgi:hypothetical protein
LFNAREKKIRIHSANVFGVGGERHKPGISQTCSVTEDEPLVTSILALTLGYDTSKVQAYPWSYYSYSALSSDKKNPPINYRTLFEAFSRMTYTNSLLQTSS